MSVSLPCAMPSTERVGFCVLASFSLVFCYCGEPDAWIGFVVAIYTSRLVCVPCPEPPLHDCLFFLAPRLFRLARSTSPTSQLLPAPPHRCSIRRTPRPWPDAMGRSPAAPTPTPRSPTASITTPWSPAVPIPTPKEADASIPALRVPDVSSTAGDPSDSRYLLDSLLESVYDAC